MPILVECEVCGAKYRVDDRRAGTTIPCKECDADMHVPEPARRGRPERGPRSGERRQRPVPQHREEYDEAQNEGGSALSNPAVLVVSLVVGGLVLAGGVFGVMYLMKDDPLPPNQVAQNDPAEQPQPNPAEQNPINPQPVQPQPNPQPVNPQPVNPQPNPEPVNPQPNPEPVNPQPRPNPFNRQPRPEPIKPPEVDIPVAKNEPVAPPIVPRGFIPEEQPATLPADLAGKWDVKPDPIPEAIGFEDERKLRIPFPSGVNIKDALWPTAPSFFVALGSNGSERDVREVFDIRTRKKVGRIGGFRVWGGKTVLSPDGKFFAVSNRDSKGVYVWDVEAEKAKGTLPLPSSWGATVLNFAGPKRLVGAAEAKAPLQVWSLPSGEPERTITLPEEYVDKSVAFSHGGKYVAFYNKKREAPSVQIFDLDTGEFAGAMSVPLKGNNSFWVPDCHCLMFSPDGEEIAGLFEETFQGKYFYVYSLKDGKHVFDYKIVEENNEWWPDANGTPIQWFPHKNRWLLFGNLILDRDIGKVVWKFSVDKNTAAARRILNNELMMGAALENNKTNLISFPVEEDKIAKVAETVESGGTLIDAKLPPLTQIDRTAVRQLALDVGGGRWSAKPDPAPAGESPLKDSLSVTATAGRMTGLLLSNPASGKAVVYSELQSRPIPGRASTSNGDYAHLDVYNLRTGRRTDQMDWDFPTKLSAFSPAGTLVASVYQPDQDRLDIWSADDGKPVQALRPYNQEDKNNRKITAVAFVDDQHLLTINNQKKLVLWKLPEAQAVYEIADAAEPGLSPNQTYLAVSTGQGYLMLDSRTGNQVGSFNIQGTMHAAAFAPDGSMFAASCTGPRGPSIVVWSMEDGGVQTEFPVQITARQMHFCDNSHLLINNETLVDLQHELIVWKYRLGSGAHSPQSPDGRHWYITPKGASGAELIAVKLPEQQVADFLATKDLKPEFLLQPGGQLSVQINLPDAGPGQTNLRQRALQNLITKYQDLGTSVGGGSDLILTMDMQERNTGKTQEIVVGQSRSPFGGAFPITNGENMTLPLNNIDCKITFTYQGKVLNEQKAVYSNAVSTWFSESLPEGKTPDQHLAEKMWGMAAGYFTNYSPPVYIFRDFEGNGLGLSTLSDRGPIPQGVGG